MNAKRRSGFTLVEVLIVVVIMAVLAATIIPQFSDSTKDAKISTVEFNLHTLRSQIELYKSQHDGKVPGAALAELTSKTDLDGAIGTTVLFPFGPYIREIPNNPFTNSKAVTSISNSPAESGDVTGSGGWLYNPDTGEIWIDHSDYFTK
jgi:prepilin-type N-terminal cleavage/methylation domain-containing protein